MSQNIIEEIRQAEDQAEHIRAQAHAEARERVRTAQEQLSLWREDELKTARHQAREAVAAAEAQAQAGIARSEQRGRELEQELARTAGPRVEALAADIVRTMVERYGSH